MQSVFAVSVAVLVASMLSALEGSSPSSLSSWAQAEGTSFEEIEDPNVEPSSQSFHDLMEDHDRGLQTRDEETATIDQLLGSGSPSEQNADDSLHHHPGGGLSPFAFF
jgi:hypothetical protein